MDGGLEVGDCHSEYGQGWIDGENILDASLVLCKIDGFELARNWGTLFYSDMEMGTISRMSMCEE